MHLDRTAKTRLMAVFIVVVMLASTAGFALIGAGNIVPQQAQQQSQLENNVLFRELTGPEVVAILRAGRTLFRYAYPGDCEDCKAAAAELRQFAGSHREFVFVQNLQRNETRLEVLGADGRAEDISNLTVTQDSLLDVLCGKGALRPKDCVLREIG